ncbi:MAG TPA: thermonuclease family protein [Dissulfurispiraceae bacterium]
MLKKVRVVRVNDGDTVTVRARGRDRKGLFSLRSLLGTTERVRLIGIDAPELYQDPWGRQAKKYLKKLLSENDWLVDIELDVEHRDKYGRLLAYLWGKDGRMINERMLEAGYAVLFTIPPNVKYAERFVAAQKRAEALRAGIWKNGGLRESPYEWRKRHPRT